MIGNPGSGKSVLASSIVDELMATYRQDCQRWELCYFFFTPEFEDSTTRTSAYRSILAQILHRNRQDDETINKFDFIMTDPSSSGTPRAGLDELFGLVKLLFQQFQILLILDGIDECEDNSSLIREIMELSESSSAKFLLCGRTNTQSLIRTVPETSQICLDRDTVSADIRLFTSTQVDLLLDDKLLPPGSNSEDLVNRLCRGADGMFLWAKLMFKYLGLPVHDPDSRLEVIYSVVLPEGLEKMYARIVDSITQTGKTSRDFASSILAWASCSMRSLTLEELYDQMKFETSKAPNVDAYQLEAFRESASIVCGGLIEFFNLPSQPTAQGVLRYIHLSVKEHFSQIRLGPESQNPLVSPEAIEHLACATRCLGYLLYHMPVRQEQLGHSNVTDPPLGKFSGYAASNWLFHLDRSFASASFNGSDISSALMRLAPTLSDFLQDSTKVKFWIHILYNDSGSCEPDGIASCLDGLVFTLADSHCLPASIGGLSKTMQRFCQDVSKALNAWDKHLRRSTNVLWDEVGIFSDSPFLAGNVKGQMISMAPNSPPCSIYPNFSLVRKASHTGFDGETTAVVSAWQNPHFPTKSVVKYELWKHNTVPTRLSEIIIPIEHQTAFDMFPISIRDDLMSFAILDRLFLLVPNGDGTSVSTHSTKIPFLFITQPTAPHTTFFKISAQGRFLLSSDSIATSWYRAGGTCDMITMSEIENERSLQIKPFLHEQFQPGRHSSVSGAIFHPTHQVVIIQGKTWVAAWNFAKEYRNKLQSSFQMLHYVGRHVKNMFLSSCGTFVVFEDLMQSQPMIVAIPRRFLAPDLSTFNELVSISRSDLEQNRSGTESLPSAGQEVSALQLSHGRPILDQILTLPNGFPSQLISVQGGEDVKISRTEIQSERTDEVANIIRLPQGQGMNEATPTILAPAPGEESIRIILNERGLDRKHQLNDLPIVIDRDIDAIKYTFYDGAGQHVDGGRAAARQQIRNREESESEQVTKRRRTEKI